MHDSPATVCCARERRKQRFTELEAALDQLSEQMAGERSENAMLSSQNAILQVRPHGQGPAQSLWHCLRVQHPTRARRFMLLRTISICHVSSAVGRWEHSVYKKLMRTLSSGGLLILNPLCNDLREALATACACLLLACSKSEKSPVVRDDIRWS